MINKHIGNIANTHASMNAHTQAHKHTHKHTRRETDIQYCTKKNQIDNIATQIKKHRKYNNSNKETDRQYSNSNKETDRQYSKSKKKKRQTDNIASHKKKQTQFNNSNRETYRQFSNSNKENVKFFFPFLFILKRLLYLFAVKLPYLCFSANTLKLIASLLLHYIMLFPQSRVLNFKKTLLKQHKQKSSTESSFLKSQTKEFDRRELTEVSPQVHASSAWGPFCRNNGIVLFMMNAKCFIASGKLFQIALIFLNSCNKVVKALISRSVIQN